MQVRDALDIIGGKWRIPILMAIADGNYRFKDILNAIPKLSAKVLTEELKVLEINLLVERVYDDNTSVTTYHTTEHARSLSAVTQALEHWGNIHREKITQ
ncbi:transcriptional regulator [Capnocytophaga sp. HP1101]